MVCTTIRPTTLPFPEIETWQECASFLGNHMEYEPLAVPTLFVSTNSLTLTFCLYLWLYQTTQIVAMHMK